MEFRSKTNDTVDVVLLSGRVVTVGRTDRFEATGDDAKSLLDHPLIERTDEPAHKSSKHTDKSDGKGDNDA